MMLPSRIDSSTVRSIMSLELRFQSASTDYQKIQTELASFVNSRTRLDAQFSENEMVKKVRQVQAFLDSFCLPHLPGICTIDP
jgi:uncharacterized protein YpuA (DUF1002 family)